MLYDPAQFEPLTDEPWDPARVADAIGTIVADSDAAFDPDALWPAHEWDGWQEPLPLKNLYVGAAGVIWALDRLRRRGHAETSLDLAAAALRALELERAEPDSTADEHYHPAALLCGETGPLLVAFRLAPEPALADDVHALVRANVANPTDDVMWGAPGTLLAALAMGEWSGEPRWEEAARESAAALRARRGDDWLWRQDDDYRGLGTLHGAPGNTLLLLRLEPDDALAAETAAVPLSMRSARTASRTGPVRRVDNSLSPAAGSVSSGARALRVSSPAPGSTSTRSSSSPAPSWSGVRAPTATKRATASATAPRATGSRSSRRSRAPATSAGSSVRAVSPSTRSDRSSASALRTAVGATRSGRATSAPPSSARPASSATRPTRSRHRLALTHRAGVVEGTRLW